MDWVCLGSTWATVRGDGRPADLPVCSATNSLRFVVPVFGEVLMELTDEHDGTQRHDAFACSTYAATFGHRSGELLLEAAEHLVARQHLSDAGIGLAALSDSSEELTIL